MGEKKDIYKIEDEEETIFLISKHFCINIVNKKIFIWLWVEKVQLLFKNVWGNNSSFSRFTTNYANCYTTSSLFLLYSSRLQWSQFSITGDIHIMTSYRRNDGFGKYLCLPFVVYILFLKYVYIWICQIESKVEAITP